MGSIYSLIGLGYVTIYRTSLVVNLAQGSFVQLGAFFAYSFLREMGLPFWLTVILGVVGVVIVAIAMFQFVLKPVMVRSFVNMILATIALSLLFEAVCLLKWGGYGVALPAFTGEKMLWIGGVAIHPQSLWIIGLMIVIFVGLYLLGSRTQIGKKMTATATDSMAARLSGISTNRVIILSFGISSAIGAIGGIAVAPLTTMLYTSGGVFGLTGAVGAILGGWGSSEGAVVGGLAVGIIQSLMTGILPAGWQDAVAFVILILILYFRPQGLFGTMMQEGEM